MSSHPDIQDAVRKALAEIVICREDITSIRKDIATIATFLSERVAVDDSIVDSTKSCIRWNGEQWVPNQK